MAGVVGDDGADSCPTSSGVGWAGGVVAVGDGEGEAGVAAGSVVGVDSAGLVAAEDSAVAAREDISDEPDDRDNRTFPREG